MNLYIENCGKFGPTLLKVEGSMKFWCCNMHAKSIADHTNSKNKKISKSDKD